MEWHKLFFHQVNQCEKDGNRWIVTAPFDGKSIVVCTQFKTYCHSKACKDVRHGMSPVGEINEKP